MPTYYKSTAKKPGGGVRKGYRRGGRNLRDEEARVIGVQDNAADELRRVRARRPHDAAERRDRRDQLARVGSRERNARDEMHRLRREAVGYQYGGGIGRSAAAVGPAASMAAARGIPTRSFRSWHGDRMARQMGAGGYQYGGAIARQAAAMGPSIAAGIPHGDDPSQGYRSLQHYLGNRRARGYQYGGAIGRQAAAMGPAINRRAAASIATSPGVAAARRAGRAADAAAAAARDRNRQMPTHRSTNPNIWNAGGRVGFKTGGRIPRKKGAKFI